jgi:hypothetical protein
MHSFARIQVSADLDVALGSVKPSPEGLPAERAWGLTDPSAKAPSLMRLCVHGRACTNALPSRVFR